MFVSDDFAITPYQVLVDPVNIQICKIQSKKSLAKVFEILIEG
jgi:hypothetical protein